MERIERKDRISGITMSPTKQDIKKIKFPNISKLKYPIPLKINVQIKSFQNHSYEDDEKITRLEKIDYYYHNIENIHKSIMGSGQKGGYKSDVIKNLYETIFGVQKAKGKNVKKNEMITQILNYYENSYVPRVGAVATNTHIDMNEENNANETHLPPLFSGTKNPNIYNDSDEDDLGDF